MSKAKKIVLIIVASFFGLLVLLNTACLAFLTWTMNDMSVNFYDYFPFLAPKDSYVKIDDVAYIRYDMDGTIILDPVKAEQGTLKVYTYSEVRAMLEEAKANSQ